MSRLVLDVRLDHSEMPIGTLVRDDFGVLSFQYTQTYLQSDRPLALSVAIPLSVQSYSDSSCRAFFGNLLQERDDTVQRVMDREGIERDDIVALLFHLGADCPGAISVLPEGAPPAKVPGDLEEDYKVLPEAIVSEIVHSFYERRPLPEDVADPSPIAGVQSKLTLTVLSAGELAQPKAKSGAPTTHILKVPSRERHNEAKLERVALILSSSMGHDTANAVPIEFDGIYAILIERYDRGVNSNGEIIRLHQEDFAQALGLPASMKYERHGRPDAIFNAAAVADLLDKTDVPALSKKLFIEATMFDLMIGNNDNHAKNFSLLHHFNGTISLAPRYDLVPVRMYNGYTEELAFKIGAATCLEEVTAEEFDEFLRQMKITNPKARLRIRNDTASKVGGHLADLLESISDTGSKQFADLIASNINHLFDEFGLEIPESVRSRDASINSAGGWLMS